MNKRTYDRAGGGRAGGTVGWFVAAVDAFAVAVAAAAAGEVRVHYILFPTAARFCVHYFESVPRVAPILAQYVMFWVVFVLGVNFGTIIISAASIWRL